MRISIAILGLALLWDRFLGEPPARIHPVVGVGKVVEVATTSAMTGDPPSDRIAGSAMAVAIPVATMAVASLAMRLLGKMGTIATVGGGAFLLKASFAVRSMDEHVSDVAAMLRVGDAKQARDRLSRLVTRDTSGYAADDVASAAISTVAENATDSVVGPLFMYGLFGVPGVMTYRAIDTLDSMVGYRDHRRHFGEASARLDDVMNLVPARLAGGAVVVAAALSGMDAGRSARMMAAEHARTPSPNSGWPIAAAAGALGVEVEKKGVYRLGAGNRRPDVTDIDRSMTLFKGAALIAAVVAAGLIVAKR
jgi:adenosylcobinamide-phosphate synthase